MVLKKRQIKTVLLANYELEVLKFGEKINSSKHESNAFVNNFESSYITFWNSSNIVYTGKLVSNFIPKVL